jgi:hypothetical protein
MPAGRACGRKKDEAVDQARVLLDRLIASGVIE